MHNYAAQFERLTLPSALADVKERIGPGGPASASVNDAYHVAHKFASLDHISGGRAGWNLVTSSSGHEARNFNFDEHRAHAHRYERAEEELADVVTDLWERWYEKAFVRE